MLTESVSAVIMTNVNKLNREMAESQQHLLQHMTNSLNGEIRARDVLENKVKESFDTFATRTKKHSYTMKDYSRELQAIELAMGNRSLFSRNFDQPARLRPTEPLKEFSEPEETVCIISPTPTFGLKSRFRPDENVLPRPFHSRQQKAPQPTAFDGESSKLETFFSALEIVFLMESDKFGKELNKMLYMAGLLEGRAAECWTANKANVLSDDPLWSTFKEMRAVIRADFGNPHERD